MKIEYWTDATLLEEGRISVMYKQHFTVSSKQQGNVSNDFKDKVKDVWLFVIYNTLMQYVFSGEVNNITNTNVCMSAYNYIITRYKYLYSSYKYP